MQDLKERATPGFAIGGLAGGEDKESFCRYCLHSCSMSSITATPWGMYIQDLLM